MQINLSNINWKNLGLYLSILILASLLFAKCENENLQLATIKALKVENTSYKLKNGQLVASAKTLIATNKEQAIFDFLIFQFFISIFYFCFSFYNFRFRNRN